MCFIRYFKVRMDPTIKKVVLNNSEFVFRYISPENRKTKNGEITKPKIK